MVTLRVVRHDRHEQVLAECQTAVIPARGEVIQLDTTDAPGEMKRPSTLWRVVSVTVHVPSLASSRAGRRQAAAVQIRRGRRSAGHRARSRVRRRRREILSESKL